MKLRIFDNGGKTADRYTILPPRHALEYRERQPGTWQAIAASAEPFHPQGFGQHVTAMPGRHLGKRIAWESLPADVQTFARQSFPNFAPREYPLAEIVDAFITCAIWADSDEGTRPTATRAARAEAFAFCYSFIESNKPACLAAIDRMDAARFGHDLYLTAAGHGAGFWDRDELEAGDIGDKLSDALRKSWHVETYQSRGWFYISWLQHGSENNA